MPGYPHKGDRPPWDWHGAVAMILALSVGGAYSAVLVITALQGGPVTDAGAYLLNNMGSVLAGGLAGWLGGAAMAAAQQRRQQQGQDRGESEGEADEPDRQ